MCDNVHSAIKSATGVAASEQGYVETALEACLSAKEKLQAIREELLKPEPAITAPRHDYNG
jgi:hypothetical protein